MKHVVKGEPVGHDPGGEDVAAELRYGLTFENSKRFLGIDSGLTTS
jgi:hypothetical protein